MPSHHSSVKAQEIYPFPSRYGSHASMVNAEATAKLTDESYVVCKDENGLYVTKKNRLDDKCADPNRYASTKEKAKALKKLMTKK